MALNSANYLKGNYDLRKTMGVYATNSDATLVIDGYENFFIFAKAFPDPSSGIGGEIEVATPLGDIEYKAQQGKTAFNGSASFYETETRDVQAVFDQIKLDGGYFDAWLYQGTPDRFINRKRLRGCFFAQNAPTQRDFQSNTEVVLLEGDIFGKYFGEIETGNVTTLMGGA